MQALNFGIINFQLNGQGHIAIDCVVAGLEAVSGIVGGSTHGLRISTLCSDGEAVSVCQFIVTSNYGSIQRDGSTFQDEERLRLTFAACISSRDPFASIAVGIPGVESEAIVVRYEFNFYKLIRREELDLPVGIV